MFTYSPLRYPGGKSALRWLVADFLRENKIEKGHYAEPFAGGCGLGLGLLFGGYVSEIYINDIDKSIWSFWHCLLHENEEFVSRIQAVSLDIEEWKKHRERYLSGNGDSLDLGFAAFYLNRTNRSGVIKSGGVIGGLAQSGPYKMNCRFNVKDLVSRVRRVYKYKDRINLSQKDALKFLDECKSLPEKSFIFIDPPYFKQGRELYANYYNFSDHEKLSATSSHLSHAHVTTYDDVPEVRKLYKRHRVYNLEIPYSLNRKRKGRELIVLSKGLKVSRAARERYFGE